jgi:uncharacterized protein YbjT (DUF2867 family)
MSSKWRSRLWGTTLYYQHSACVLLKHSAHTRWLENAQQVHRIVLVSAAVLFPEKGITLAFFRWLLQHISRDLKTAEDIVRSAQFDWTIVRPSRLTNESYSSYRIASEALPPKGNVASFRAVATFMLDSVEQRSHLRELVGLWAAQAGDP